MQSWLATWLAYHEELDAESVPAHVERDTTRQEDLWTGRLRHPDPPADVMPDYENQNQDLVW